MAWVSEAGRPSSMGLYDRHVLPRVIDLACSSKPTRRQREKVVPFAAGDVLEIGMGSGLNLPFYDRAKVRKIVGLEPSDGMRRLARHRGDGAGLALELIDGLAEDIPLDSSSVDDVVVTYTLCTVGDPGRALAEMRRVLRPGGRLLFCEHGIAPDRGVARWQRRIAPLWCRFSGGCHLDRDIPGLLQAAGFALALDERMYVPGVRALSYNFWGTAFANADVSREP